MESQEHLTEEQIALFAEAINTGTEYTIPDQWRAHVDGCAQCAFEVTAVSELVDKEQHSAQPFLKQSSPNWLLQHKFILMSGIAASILLIAVLGYFLLQERVENQDNIIAKLEEQLSTNSEPKAANNSKESVPLSNKADTGVNKNKPQVADNLEEADLTRNIPETTRETNQKELAYVPQEHLEALTQRFTDGNMRSEQGTFSYPAIIRAKSGESITLPLDTTQHGSVILEFLDNSGQKLFEETTSEHRYSLQKLQSPGLYYYKVIGQEFDLLFCGKIIIDKE